MEFYIAILLILAFILIALFVYFFRDHSIPGVKPFSVTLLLVSIWNIMYAANLLSYNLKVKVILFIIMMSFIEYIPSVWLMTTLELTARRRFMDIKNVFIVIIPSITVILLIFSRYNNWFMYDFYLKSGAGFEMLKFHTGFWFWIGGGYNYLINIINIGLLLKLVFSKQYAMKKQAITMIVGMLIPIFCDILFVVSSQANNYPDFTPVSFMLSLLITGYSILNYGFMDIIPIARECVFEDMDELMIIIDENKKIVDMNNKALKMFNTKISYIVGMKLDKVIKGISTYDFYKSQNSLLKISLKHEYFGNKVYYYGSVNAIKSKTNRVLGYLLLLQEVTELHKTQLALKQANEKLKMVNEELYKESIRDGLTGIFNKKNITMCLQREIETAANNGEILTIAIIDIDYFKKVNDKYGHLVGDNILQKIVELIKLELGDRGILGRFGGEEFLIIMPNTNLKAGCEICEAIRLKISEYSFEEVKENITISIGVSHMKSQENIKDLIKRADDKLYKAKLNGRNNIEFQ